MKHASLFTGIGGFDLAAEWMGWDNIFQVEINEFCQTKLLKNFPNVKKYTDIKLFDGKPYAGRVDVLSGGFPCQTFSVAGKGTTDITLWKEMYRTITEIKPPFVVAENVPGIVSRKNGMAFNIVCSDLEAQGYEVQPLNIPIAGKGAPHERERIWFIAYSDRFRCDNEQKESGQTLHNKKRNGAIEKQSGRKFQCGTGESDSDLAYTDGSNEFDISREFRKESEKFSIVTDNNSEAINSNGKRPSGQGKHRGQMCSEQNKEGKANRFVYASQFQEPWIEVATRLCRMDDGIPNRMDRIISMGNAISPLLAYDFFKCIEETNNRMRAAGC